MNYETPIEPEYPKGKRSPDATLTELRASEDRIKGAIAEMIASIPTKISTTDLNARLDRIEAILGKIDAVKSVNITLSGAGSPVLVPPVDTPPADTPPVFTPTPQPNNGFLYGANVSGGEMKAVPPRDDPKYPSKGSVDFLYDHGFNCMRVPFKWHRVQATLNGTLEAWHVNQLTALVKYAATKNIVVVLDCHNYAERDGVKSSTIIDAGGNPVNALLGSPELPVSTYVDFWARMSTAFKELPNVHFCIANEPKCTIQVWRPAVDLISQAIRGAGFKGTLHIPGTGWTGFHSWMKYNAGAFEDFTDPNFFFDVHQYFDSDFSGTHSSCKLPPFDKLQSAVQWARRKPSQRKFFVGEFAAGDPSVAGNEICGQAFPQFVDFMDANRDVIVGYAVWAAGAISPNYMFRVELTDGKETYMTNLLRSKMPKPQ